MARKKQEGNRFFRMDADFSDRKIKILKARYGADGIVLYLYLLCEIYKTGYYLQVDDDFEYIISDDLNMDGNKVKQVLNFLLERSLFDDTLFQSDKTILFEIDPDRGGIVYVGENALSMDDYTAIRNKKRAKDAPALEGAKQFIIDQMPDGSRLASEIVTLAKARHISERSLRRAREELQIIVQKTKEFPPKSLWVLPEKAGQPEEPQAVQETLPL